MSLLDALRYRWRVFTHPRSYDREMDEEFRFHLSIEEMQQHHAGRGLLTTGEARARARGRFGNWTYHKEESRAMSGLGFFDTTSQDLRFAFRTLRRAPGFTVVAILTLALGIGANAAVFSIVYGIVFRPLPYPNPQSIVELTESSPRGSGEKDVTYDELQFLQQHDRGFQFLAGYTVIGYNLGVGDKTQRVKGLPISADYFHVLGIQPQLGRDFLPEDNIGDGSHVAILSNGIWQRQMGGDRGIVGRTITLDGEPFTVIGVMPPGLEGTFDPILPGEPDVWTPLALAARTDAQGANVEVLARIRQGVSFAQARARIHDLTPEFHNAFPSELGPTTTLSIQSYQTMLSSDVRTILLVLFGAVGFVLLIACANIANLLLGRAAARSREFAMRAALGASRTRLLRQLLTESVLLSIMAAVLALLVARIGMRSLVALSPSDLPRAHDIQLDGRGVVFTLAVAVITGILFGLVPAFRASSGEIYEKLGEATTRVSSGRGHGRFRAALVVSETALCLVLLTGAALLIETFLHVLNTDPGFNPTHVLAVEVYLSGSRYDSAGAVSRYYDEAVQRIEALPGVQSTAAIAAGLPMQRGGNSAVALRGENVRQSFDLRMVTPGFFRTMGVRIVRGRPLSASDDENSPPVTVINQTAARALFSERNPIGEMLNVLGADRKIVGVVGDVKSFLDQPAQPGDYIPLRQTPFKPLQLFEGYFATNIVVRTSADPLALSHSIEQQLQTLDPSVGIGRVRTMGQVRSAAVAMREFNMTLLSVFAGLALVLAAIGMYGVIAYSVTQRTHEIGVRLALGAARGDVMRMLLGQGIVLAGLGIGLGLAGALVLTRLLESYLYRVQPTDPIALGATALFLGAVAVLASYIPARRATKVDPLIALRQE
jgi:putative ABC transport system permease protein